MADKKKGNKGQKGIYKDVLGDFGVTHGFQLLIDQAIRNQWTQSEFERHLAASKPFQKQFPGLVDRDGGVNPFLGADLRSAVNAYQRLEDQYHTVARNYPGVRLNRDMLGTLIRNDVSVDEFARRATINATLRSNPALQDQFNEQLKVSGKKPLDPLGMRKFLAGASSRDYYDTYQAAYLRSSGLNFDAKTAQQVARGLDSPLSPNLDLGKLVADVQRVKTDIAPELAREGITDADLTLLAAGSDPRGIGGKVEQIVAQRRASTQRQQGTYARQTSTGGLGIYPEEEAASY